MAIYKEKLKRVVAGLADLGRADVALPDERGAGGVDADTVFDKRSD